MKVEYNSTNVSWEYNGKKIEITLDKVLHARFSKYTNKIEIETGEGFIEEWVYYYTLTGVFLAKQHLDTGEITWFHNGEHRLSLPYTETIGFYPDYELIFIIYRHSEEESSVTAIKVIYLDGNLINSLDSPEGYTMLYVSEIKDEKVRVACEAIDRENYDPYGRSRFHFALDLKDQKWVKDGLAY